MAEDAEQFGHAELEDIARRASTLARRTTDPSLRIALSLFGESALNLAAKMPRPAPEPAAPAREP
jgi:hypothetical protein